jgi:DNA (cytosine-5)-methyltransferase 1
LRVLDLFSGIGGFSLGLERTGGFETVAFCEIEPFPRRVLAKHWPGVPCYDDVRTLTSARLAADGITVDVITGGFPCQDLSVAGKQRGMGEGTRSGLWSEIVRLIGDLRPRYIIVENVAALLSGPSERRGGWFGRVLGDLAECGYDAEWENIPASALGAPHRRERVWLVCYPSENERSCIGCRNGMVEWHQLVSPGRDKEADELVGSGSHVAYADQIHAQGQQPGGIDAQRWARPLQRPARPLLAGVGRQWVAEPDVGRVAHGVPDRAHRLAALGNAVVPQIPELIGRAILQAEAQTEIRMESIQ